MYSGTPTSSGVKKLVQVSEEFKKPVHVPIVLGAECFVITQQDMRRIEDVRFLSYHKLGPNGELIPVDGLLVQDNALGDAFLNAAKFFDQHNNAALFRQLLELLENNRCKQIAPCPTVASIAQQMEWERSPANSSPPFPLTYNKATSIDNIPRLMNCCFNPPCRCNCSPRYVVHEACNTTDESSTDPDGLPSAKRMLKLRKVKEDTLGV